jgi:hypothetical protein
MTAGCPASIAANRRAPGSDNREAVLRALLSFEDTGRRRQILLGARASWQSAGAVDWQKTSTNEIIDASRPSRRRPHRGRE